jgi:hypothetical protein
VIVCFALFVVFFFPPARCDKPALHFEQVPLYACLDTISVYSQKLCPRISEQTTPFLPCRWVFGLCKRGFFSLSLSSLARHSAEAPHRNRLYNNTNKYPT